MRGREGIVVIDMLSDGGRVKSYRTALPSFCISTCLYGRNLYEVE